MMQIQGILHSQELAAMDAEVKKKHCFDA